MTLTRLDKTKKPYKRKFFEKLKRVTTIIEIVKKEITGFRDNAL